jgi:hypothetical protein
MYKSIIYYVYIYLYICTYLCMCVCVYVCMYVCIYLYRVIQEESALFWEMSDFKQKSSYEHGSDFERLRSYGHFLFPVHALM